MARTRKAAQSAQTAQAAQEPQNGQIAEAPEAQAAPVAPATAEELMAEVERLRAALAEAQAKPARKPRVKRPSPKQARVMEYLRKNPDAAIGEACKAAGATETSHGLVFRMIEDGYLKVSVAYEPEEETAPPTTEEAPAEAEAEAPAEEAVKA